MKRFLCTLAVVLFGMLPADGAGFSEAIKVDANGRVMPLTSSSNDKRAVTFMHGVGGDPANLGITKEVFVSLRPTDEEPPCTANLCGSGTKGDPYNANGTTTAIKADRLDAIVAHCNGDYFIHVAKGTYYFRGRSNTVGTVFDGNHWKGEGMNETIIKLYNASNSPADGQMFARAGNNAAARTSNFVMEDLWLDCDATNQPTWSNGSTNQDITARRVQGSDNHLYRVKITGYGCNHAGIENIAIIDGPIIGGPTGDFSNNTIEDCQFLSTVNTVTGATVVTMGPKGAGSTGKTNRMVRTTIDFGSITATIKTAADAPEISGCTFIGATNGIYIERGGGGVDLYPRWFHDNVFFNTEIPIHIVAQPGVDPISDILIENNIAWDCLRLALIGSDDGLGTGGGTATYFTNVTIRNNKSLNTDASVDASNLKLLVNAATNTDIEGNIINASVSSAIDVAAVNKIVSNNKRLDGTLTPYAIQSAIGGQQTVKTSNLTTADVNATGNVNTGNLMWTGNAVGNLSGGYGMLANHIQSNIRHTLSDAYVTARDDYMIFADHDAVTRTFTLTDPVLPSDTQYIIIKDGANTGATHNIVISAVDGGSVSITTNSGAASCVFDPKVGWTLLWKR